MTNEKPDSILGYRIEALPETKIAGKCMRMCLAGNKTPELWRSFMPRRREIANAIGSTLFSVQVYDGPLDIAEDFNAHTIMDKWAGVEVPDFEQVPDGMETLVIPAGLYAVFNYQGAASKGGEAFRYIFGTWLPALGYATDQRPHFERLGEKYKNEDPASEEELWIPVKPVG